MERRGDWNVEAMWEIIFKIVMGLLPKRALSHFVGWVVNQESPAWLAIFIRDTFVKSYNINMDLAEFSKDKYPSLGKLFARRLKPGLRPIQGTVIHPADSVLTQFGRIDGSTLIQAKGRRYTLESFLKSSSDQFRDGFFLTYYLCPTDYHRVHFPAGGLVEKINSIPGALWPVNKISVRAVPELFSVNERKYSIISTPRGHCAVVMVGATNVGSIEITHHVGETKKAGDEFGIFNMGSTVVVLYEKNFFSDAEFQKIKPGPVLVGQAIF